MINTTTIFFAQTEQQVADYFKSKGAISEATAIELDLVKLKTALQYPEYIESDILNYEFVKKCEGKYYLDSSSYKKMSVRTRKLIFLMLVSVLIPMILFAILYAF